MSQSQMNLNAYSQTGCIGCKPCEGGGANIGRNALLWTIGIFTAGIGLIFLPFYKKCQYCSHNTWLNKHTPWGGTHQHQAPTQSWNGNGHPTAYPTYPQTPQGQYPQAPTNYYGEQS